MADDRDQILYATNHYYAFTKNTVASKLKNITLLMYLVLIMLASFISAKAIFKFEHTNLNSIHLKKKTKETFIQQLFLNILL